MPTALPAVLGVLTVFCHLCVLQAQLLFEAQLVDSTTSNVLSLAIGGLPAGQAADVRRNIGAVLIREVEARMQPDGSGAAHTVQGAWQQAHAVLLLQAIGHPAAELFGLPPCPPIVEAEARGSHHPGVASKVSPRFTAGQGIKHCSKQTIALWLSYACSEPCNNMCSPLIY